jgi:hypothetical protein
MYLMCATTVTLAAVMKFTTLLLDQVALAA